ncbi:MAG: hypothetical protein LBU83_04520, partial [Bacteroidales bacterium]|nr:hypothetical protein [Bacteroidales bacterium]
MKNLDSAPSSLRTVTSDKLRVTSYELRVTSDELQVTSDELQVTSDERLLTTHYSLPLLITLILLLFSSCNRINNPNVGQSVSLCTDSLWTPTGDAELDSLLQLAAVAPQDTTLAELYYKIGFRYYDFDFEKSKEYYIKLGDLSEMLDWKEGYYLYAYGITEILRRENLVDSADVILQKALDLAKLDKNESWIASFLFYMGNNCYFKDWYATALDYYMEAILFYEKNNDSKSLSNIYSMMSETYRSFDAMDKAIEYGEKAVALNEESEILFYFLGSSYSNENQFEKANICFEEALRLADLHGNLHIMVCTLHGLAYNALDVFDLDKAEKYLQQSLEADDQFSDDDWCLNYLMFGRLEMLKGNLSKSEEYIKEALQMAIECDHLHYERLCYFILADLAFAQHKYREYLQYWEKIASVEIAIGMETTRVAAEEMAAKYETEKKQLEIERQKTIIEKQNLQRGIFIGGIAICVAILALLFFLLRLRIRHNKTLTEKTEILAEINATKDKFFSIISHDLRSPAIAQREAIQLLCNKAQQWDKATLLDYSQNMLQSADSQVELLNNLLSWAQLQSGRMDCVPLPANLSVT